MRLLGLTALVALIVDQVTKYWVIWGLDLITLREIEVFPPYLVFRKGLNLGINFGLFARDSEAQRWILIAIALALCTLMLLWARHGFRRRIEFACAGLVIGGALGNSIDRVFHEGVLDFLNMSCCGIDNPYVFNVADIFIFAGAIGLVLFSGGGDRPRKARRKKAP